MLYVISLVAVSRPEIGSKTPQTQVFMLVRSIGLRDFASILPVHLDILFGESFFYFIFLSEILN
jgi:hypothetical protein